MLNIIKKIREKHNSDIDNKTVEDSMKRFRVFAGLLAIMAVMLTATGCGNNNETVDTAVAEGTTTVTQQQGTNSVMKFYTNPEECSYMRNPDFCIYYTDSMTEDKAEVYYNQGTWLMYSGDKFTQLQQYCVTDVNKTLEEVAKSIPVFNEDTATYYGYSADNQIVELDKTQTFKETQADYIFIEWITDDYSYSYTYQAGDVSVYSIYTDSLNLFREYSKVYEQYMQQQASESGTTTETTDSTAESENTETVAESETEATTAESEETKVSE